MKGQCQCQVVLHKQIATTPDLLQLLASREDAGRSKAPNPLADYFRRWRFRPAGLPRIYPEDAIGAPGH
jgi:hypothetical protein